MALSPEKEKALSAAMSQIDRKFGKGSIMKMGEAGSRLAIEVIPTGAIALDIALGIGGLPRGRVIEIFGPESSGKTTLAQHIIAEAQKLGGVCAFIDAEHAFDPIYAERCGVQTKDLLVSQPDTGEQALEICETLVRSNAIDVIVIDSVAALVPKAEIEGEMGDQHVGLQARLMSQALRKLSGAINKSRTVVIFLNQLRMKIGVMFGCFPYDAQVLLADGRREQIGTLVEQRMPVELLSYNQETGQFEPRRIVNWFDNGPAEQFLAIQVTDEEGGVTHQVICTPNHLLLGEDGYQHAEEFRVGDRLMTMADNQGRSVGAEHAVQPMREAIALPITAMQVRPAEVGMHRFDLEVEGNHNYLVDGVVVHNSPETTTGGQALKFYASVRLDIRRIETLKSGQEAIGARARVKVIKNKVAPPFRQAEFDILANEGISREGNILDIGVEMGIIRKSGAWFYLGEDRLGQGRENVRTFLKENKALTDEIERLIKAQSLTNVAVLSATSEESDGEGLFEE